MSARWLSVFLLFSVACYAGQQSACETGSGPTPVPVVSASPSPSPSPSASPTPSPKESCDIDYMILRPQEGLVLPLNQETVLDLTPYQTVHNPDGSVAQREVSRACNDPRIGSIIWNSSSASIVFVSYGFNPTIRRFGVGPSTITATLEGHTSNAIVIRTP